MIEVTERRSGLRAVDADKNEVTITASEWTGGGAVRGIDHPVDEQIAGQAKSFQFPEAAVCVSSPERNQWNPLGNDAGPHSIEHGDHLVHVEADIKVYIRFENTAVVSHTNDRGIHIDFPERTHVTLGFRSPLRRPLTAITVPGTPTGLATALTYSGVAHETATPDRAYPTLRNHPPLIELGPETEIPGKVQRAHTPSGIEFHVPPALPSLFITAPLAYYLQATVRVTDHDSPLLSIPATNVTHGFSPMPAYQTEVTELLKRVFYLDCLVREAGPYGVGLSEKRFLEDINLDASQVYDLPPDERLTRYLAVPYNDIAEELPEWHLSMAIDPSRQHIPTLPHVLDRLAIVSLPEYQSIDKSEVVPRSLETTPRTSAQRDDGFGDNLIVPQWDHGRIHGWIADGYPIGAFKCPPGAFDHRFGHVNNRAGPIRLIVVLNDPDMDAERVHATRIYRARAEELTIDLDIRRNLTTEALADVFESHVEFVHFIGHCDPPGLRCRDGHLTMNTLDEANAEIFFLNACGSYHEGLELVRRGSVAGGVTINDVLDEQATAVGIAFARLIVYGCSIALALQLASSQTIVSKNYAVVGDGTHSISQGAGQFPTRITDGPDNSFFITGDMVSVRDHGSVFQPYWTDSDAKVLLGNSRTHTVDARTLVDHLEIADAPVIYNGDFYWSDDLHEELATAIA